MQGTHNVGPVKLFVELGCFQILIIEEAHVRLGILPYGKILSGFLTAATDGQNFGGKFGIGLQLVCKVSIEFFCPLHQQAIDLIGVHTGNDVLGNVGELGIIEQRTCRIQLLCIELEGIGSSVGISPAPVFEVGIQQSHDILIHCLYRETLGLIVGQSQFGVLSLTKLALGGTIHLHQGSNVNILGQLEAQSLKQLDMEGQGRQPFVAADHMGSAHEMIVHSMGKVIGGDAV